MKPGCSAHAPQGAGTQSSLEERMRLLRRYRESVTGNFAKANVPGGCRRRFGAPPSPNETLDRLVGAPEVDLRPQILVEVLGREPQFHFRRNAVGMGVTPTGPPSLRPERGGDRPWTGVLAEGRNGGGFRLGVEVLPHGFAVDLQVRR